MILEVLADGDGVVMNESSSNLILPKRTWRSFGLKRKSDTKTVDYGSRGSLSFSQGNNDHRVSRRSDLVITPEPSVFSEESLRRFHPQSSSDEEDDESSDLCHESSKLYKILHAALQFIVSKGLCYTDSCPREWRIPLFLVVGGVTAILSNLINSVLYFLKKRRQFNEAQVVDLNRSTNSSIDESEDEPRTSNLTDYWRNRLPCQITGLATSLLHTFALTWFFAGCVWVYGARNVDTSNWTITVKNITMVNQNYCHRGVYYFAFWMLNLCFLIIFFSLFVALLNYVWSSVKGQKTES